MKKNADGSVTVCVRTQGARRAGGQPGKSWNTILRLYAPLEPWFDKTWKPGYFERID